MPGDDDEGAEMAKQLVPINGSVLRWAREEVGLSEAAFAEAVKAEPAEVVRRRSR